ncbi:MAG: STAS domain-containing protein [Solirubrobacteraceae bacterium]
MTDGLMFAQLTIERTDSAGESSLVLHGELDMASCPLLADELKAVEASGAGRVVIDLRRLEFMDSCGLHALLEAERRCRTRGQRLSLRRGPRAVQQVFDLTQTASAFCFEG